MINREIFRNFFEVNKEWINNHSLLITNNLKEFCDIYEQFMKKNNLTNDEEFKAFRVIIKNEILKSLKSKDLIKRVMNLRKSPSNSYIYIDNPTINKWYLSSRVQYVIEKADLVKLNSSIIPKIKQNKIERDASFKDASKIIVK